MIRKSILAILAAGSLFAVSPAQAEAVQIVSAQLVDLYSATFDGALNTDCSAAPDLELCDFFGGNHFLNPRNIQITNFGTGSGVIDFDGTTLNQLDIQLPELQLVINAGTATETVINTNGAASPDGIFANASGTPHSDNAGTSNWQHEGAPNIVIDFATFTDIVDTTDPEQCSGALCALIGVLSLDGVRYQLDGTPTPLGGDDFTLWGQTGNNSIYQIDFQTAVIPVPAAAWLFGSALGLLGWLRRRNA